MLKFFSDGITLVNLHQVEEAKRKPKVSCIASEEKDVMPINVT